VAHSVEDQLNNVLWEVLKHHVYSLDIPPCSSHIIRLSKKALKFTSENDIEESVVHWFRQQPNKFFADGIH
jgi:hypothetical protein